SVGGAVEDARVLAWASKISSRNTPWSRSFFGDRSRSAGIAARSFVVRLGVRSTAGYREDRDEHPEDRPTNARGARRAAAPGAAAARPLKRPRLSVPSPARPRRGPTSRRLPGTSGSRRPRCAPAAPRPDPPLPPCTEEPVVITLQHISKTFPARRRSPAVTALDDVSLRVERGQVMGVV